jgi:hypothetical protein
VVGHQTRDIDYTRLTGGPISTEVLEAAGVAGVSDADPARYMCIVDDSKDWTEESAKRTNPSRAVAQLMRITEQAERRLYWALELMHIKERAEKCLKALNPSPAVVRLMHIKEQAEKRLTQQTAKLKRECAQAPWLKQHPQLPVR